MESQIGEHLLMCICTFTFDSSPSPPPAPGHCRQTIDQYSVWIIRSSLILVNLGIEIFHLGTKLLPDTINDALCIRCLGMDTFYLGIERELNVLCD